MGKATKEQCLKCECADRTISYSDWWYCNNPKDFRDFTVLRDNCLRPEWCSEELLTKVKDQIIALEKQKKTQPGYYAMCSVEHHKLFIQIKKELEKNANLHR